MAARFATRTSAKASTAAADRPGSIAKRPSCCSARSAPRAAAAETAASRDHHRGSRLQPVESRERLARWARSPARQAACPGVAVELAAAIYLLGFGIGTWTAFSYLFSSSTRPRINDADGFTMTDVLGTNPRLRRTGHSRDHPEPRRAHLVPGRRVETVVCASNCARWARRRSALVARLFTSSLVLGMSGYPSGSGVELAGVRCSTACWPAPPRK